MKLARWVIAFIGLLVFFPAYNTMDISTTTITLPPTTVTRTIIDLCSGSSTSSLTTVLTSSTTITGSLSTATSNIVHTVLPTVLQNSPRPHRSDSRAMPNANNPLKCLRLSKLYHTIYGPVQDRFSGKVIQPRQEAAPGTKSDKPSKPTCIWAIATLSLSALFLIGFLFCCLQMIAHTYVGTAITRLQPAVFSGTLLIAFIMLFLGLWCIGQCSNT